jgi:cupin 2 domain-containing protein
MMTNNVTNLFSSLPATLSDAITETLVQAKSVLIEGIVPHGHASPPVFWYDQDENEFVSGEAQLQHRGEWTTPDEPTIWLAVHCTSESPCDR